MSEKEIILINASPKLEARATSAVLADRLGGVIGEGGARAGRIDVRRNLSEDHAETDFEAMRRADAWVLIFPLYFYCLPGLLMRFLQDFDRHQREHGGLVRKPRVYAVVNCGFPESGINAEAVEVVARFAEVVNATFRFGVMIGAGPMLHEAENIPFMKKTLQQLDAALTRVRDDALSDTSAPQENQSIDIRLPRKLYLSSGDKGWLFTARKNGLSKKDLYAKPYRG